MALIAATTENPSFSVIRPPLTDAPAPITALQRKEAGVDAEPVGAVVIGDGRSS